VVDLAPDAFKELAPPPGAGDVEGVNVGDAAVTAVEYENAG